MAEPTTTRPAPVRGMGPPPEVVHYFADKGLKPGFSWLDVWGAEHAHAFTVAKAVDLELLALFKTSIQEAIAKGQSLETWKAGLRDKLAALGWWGPRMVSDPTGREPDRMVDFSRSRRLEIIFRSNMAAARSAGQWERAQRTKKVLPFILYQRTTAADPRPEHLRLVGIILPVDHPFWRTYWPPNGWLCQCHVRQISASEAKAKLARPPKGGEIGYTATPPDLGPPRRFVNRRTGEVTEVPAGIDPGWQTNAGLARSTTLLHNLETRLATAPETAGTRALTDLWSDPFMRLAPQLPEKSFLPAGVSETLAGELDAASPVISVPTDVVTAREIKHGMTMDDFAQLPRILAEGTVLPDPRGEAAVRAVYWLADDGKTWWRAFVKRSGTGLMRVNSLHQRSLALVRKAFEEAGIAWGEK